MAHPIATIGYQRADIGAVTAALAAAGVRTLIDVRAVPHSRKPGFGKQALAAAARAAGIAYRHLGGLGNPEAGRRAAKEGRMDDYLAIFGAWLDGAEARRSLAEAAELMGAGPVCLLCYEREPADCHRAIVAERLAAATGAAVYHLYPASAAETR